MLLVIDNKDSFTYNIVDYLKQCYTGTIKVVDVDEIDIDKRNHWRLSYRQDQERRQIIRF